MISNIVTPDPHTTILINYNKENMFFKIQKAIRLTFQTEYEMVKLGLRKANVFHLIPEMADKQIEQVIEDGLIFLPIHRTKRYSGFSHKHNFVENLDKGSMSYGVVAKDLETAKKFKIYQGGEKDNTDHFSTGELLGYPECCSKTFEPYFQKASDPVWEVCEATEGCRLNNENELIVEKYNPNLLIHLRYIGIRIIPWFPCNLLCKESIKRSEEWIKVMNSLDPETTDFIQEMLSIKGQIWDLMNSQAVITVPSYFKIIATSDYIKERKIIKFL